MRRARDRASRPPSGRAPPVLKNAKKGGGGYMDDMDLPSSESEGETETVEREQKTIVLGGKTEKEERKARQKELEAARKEAMAKEQAMQEDDDAFNVRCANLTDEHREQMANSKDIKIDGFSVSARGKELLTNTDLTIVHGRRYGLVGPNGMGKTTVMKLLARRKLPVPDFIDILLVEQEVVGDDRSALESVVAADVELQQLRKRKMELEAAMERVAAAEEKGGEEGSAERDRALAEALEACRISEEDDSGMQGKLAMEAKRKESGELPEETFDLSVELNKTSTGWREERRHRRGARGEDSARPRFYRAGVEDQHRAGAVQHAQHHQVLLRGACAFASPKRARCSSSRRVCCWTSPPTTSIYEP